MKMMMRLVSVAVFCFGVGLSAQTQKSLAAPVTLARQYRVGEAVAYRMTGRNESHARTIQYEGEVSGFVKSEGTVPFEELQWSALQINGQAMPLSAASQEFREWLSLDPGYKLGVPDLSKVEPVLIGPITDLLTFYADVQLAMRQTGLAHVGDQVYFKHGMPNSWADGHYTLLGEDSIDFDMTLTAFDPATQVATLVVRHVPPAEPQVKLPADWMRKPVGDARNNWVQVQRLDDKYAASVGQETFEADIRLVTPSGRILSATLDNPVEVVERDCSDPALTTCAAPVHYKILRKITLAAKP